MKHVVKLLGLLLLLIVAQQGAMVHELSHVSAGSNALNVSSTSILDSSCAQCPGFAQVVSPAFSHSFYVPSLIRTAYEVSAEPIYAAIDTAVPRPRSRGPPV
jgi:hypothetical protein